MIPVEDTLKLILKELQNLNQRVGNIEAEQKSVKADLQSVKNEQQSMRADLQSIKDMLTSQGEHVQQLIQITGATNAHLNDIRKTQIDNVKVLELLSIRSISQEADIAELRRII